MKYFVLLAGYGEMPLWDELTPERSREPRCWPATVRSPSVRGQAGGDDARR